MGFSDRPTPNVGTAPTRQDIPGARSGMTSPLAPPSSGDKLSLRDHESYVSLTMEFRCNLKCVHCMIEDTMDRLRPTSNAVFDKVLSDQRATGRWEGLVLTGSEITLRRDLPELAQRARAAGFKRVRIQTHGMHLGRPGYAERLVNAGVNEYFVSVAGASRESHDAITAVPGAWDKMMEGMSILDKHEDVRLITNTVVTTRSYRELPDMVDALSGLRRLVQLEFWNYFPMAETDEKDLCVRHADLLPYIKEAILKARAQGRFVEVKNIPECLMDDLHDALVNAQPLLVIDPNFWKEFDRNEFHQCPHRAACSSTECLGLTSAYVHKFGNESDVLRPIVEEKSTRLRSTS